jgi:hypothetical protein
MLIVSAPVPPMMVSTFLSVPVLATLASVKIDRHGRGQRGAEGDDVRSHAAGDRLDVADAGSVGECAEDQPVVAGTEIDRAVGDGGPSVMVSAPVPPMMVSTFLSVPVLAALAAIRSIPRPGPCCE